jgi:hypothetical protein
MAEIIDFSKYLKNLSTKKESFSESSFDIEELFKALCEYFAMLSDEGKLDSLTLSKDFFKYLSGVNLMLLVNDAWRRDVFKDIDDMKSRVSMFLSAMQTCFDVETTDIVIKDKEDN